MDSPTASDLSGNLFRFAEELEARKDFFNAILTNWVQLVTNPLSQQFSSVLIKCPDELLGQIIMKYSVSAPGPGPRPRAPGPEPRAPGPGPGLPIFGAPGTKPNGSSARTRKAKRKMRRAASFGVDALAVREAPGPDANRALYASGRGNGKSRNAQDAQEPTTRTSMLGKRKLREGICEK